jgi:3-hydroxyacyl-CoA dehydrogenase/enoyl-CoA hydratase/3-hydroxybutyryl-CoA epimerase
MAPDSPDTKADATGPVTAWRHWHGVRDDANIHWLTLDKADAGTNTLSQDVLAALIVVLDELEENPPAGLVFRSGKANGFIAGADVGEFRGLTDNARVEELVKRGHAVIDRIERLPYPTVALIHGFCLGGGLELALACRYRIADDDARLGLPEVRLGIHPGLGGTARLPRLIPAPAAMGLMLTGRSLRARAARRAGIVDAVTKIRHFERAAQRAIAGGLRHKRRPVLTALLNSAPLRWPLAAIMRRKTAAKARPEHYPAPFALIDLWQRHGGSKRRMLQQEAASIARLITGDTAQNLVRVFFLSEHLKSLGKESGAPIGHVHVIGAGTMGGDIAAWCALHGLTVSLQDQEPAFIAPAIARAAKLYRRRIRNRALEQAALDRLIPDVRGDGVAHADVVIEAIPESLELKQKVFQALEPRLKPDAILATNTSSIPLEDIAAGLDRPERLIGLHFFNPVAQMPLLEVVHGKDTDDAMLQRGLAFGRKIDKLPLPVRSSPGFLVNRVLTPYLMEAVILLSEGHAPEAIDAAAEDFGMPMGPLELADTVGLDVCLHVGTVLASEIGGEPPARLKQLVEDGRLGRKAEKGFYDYRKGKPVKGKTAGAVSNDLKDRLILPLLDACVACLREQRVGSADELDAGMVFGAGFAPFRGGPIQYLRQSGAADLCAKMEALEKSAGPRYRPDDGWKTLADV